MTLENSTCNDGSPLGTRATIANIGSGSAGSFTVEINGAQTTISGLAAGESRSVWVPGYQYIGQQTVVVADVFNTVSESNETNNTFTGQVPIPTPPPPCDTPTPTATATPTSTPIGDLPDLIVSYVQVTLENPLPCYDGSPLGTRATIANIGSANAGSFAVEINGVQATISSLITGGSTSVWVPGYQYIGQQTVVVADVSNMVSESNETNNTFVSQVPIPTPPPPCDTPTPTPTSTIPETTIFFDDFESDQGWTVNTNGTDTAIGGQWERANPEETSHSGITYQLGTTVSGSYALTTGPLAGNRVGAHDVDGGVTTVRSPGIALPLNSENITLDFSYYLAHHRNGSSDDYLRVWISGHWGLMLFEETASANIDEAAWQNYSVDLSSFAGQMVFLTIEAADEGTPSLIEAAIDDVRLMATFSTPTPTSTPTPISTP